MRRLFLVCSLLALGLFLAFSLVAAQTAIPTGLAADQAANDPVSPSAIAPRTSHTLVQNMEALTASLHIQYYAENGTVAHEFDSILAPNGSRTYHANDYPLGTSFLGSMVVSSDRQIVAVVLNAGDTSHDLYEGSSQGSTEQFLPSVHWRAAQYTLSGFQNTDPALTATVVITYFNQSGTDVFHTTMSIPPNTAIHRDSRSDVNCSEPCVGSIKATSLNGQRIAVAAIETYFDETNSYRGFSPDQAATVVYLPSVHRNLGGQFSHSLVQNMTDEVNQVRITYYNQSGLEVDHFDQNIPARGAWTFHTTPDAAQSPTHLGNVGSAKVESLNAKNMVVVCLENVGSSTIYSYDGLTQTDAASSLLFPSVHRNPAGQFSHTLVQNLSTSSAANLHLTYYRQDGSIADQFDKTLAASGSYTFHTDGGPEVPTNLGNVGSLRVQCTNCSPGGTRIVGIVIETRPGLVPAAYAGFKEN